MSKRLGFAATVATMAILGACADRGEPGGDDPAKIECQQDEYLQVGSFVGSTSYDTKLEAAEAFVQGGAPTANRPTTPSSSRSAGRTSTRSRSGSTAGLWRS